MKGYIYIQLFFLYVILCFIPPIPLSFWKYLMTGIFLVLLPLRYWILPVGFIIIPEVREMMGILLINPAAGFDFSRSVAQIVLSYSLNKVHLTDLQAWRFEESFWKLFNECTTRYAWLLFYIPLILIDLVLPIISVGIWYLIARWLVKSGAGIKQLLKG